MARAPGKADGPQRTLEFRAPQLGRGRGRGARRGRERGPLRFLTELPVLIVLALVLALLIKTFLVQAFYIPSESMVPTLHVGDRVLVNKLAYRFHGPSRGDVIVFADPHPSDQPRRGLLSSIWHWVIEGLGVSQAPNEDFIKRVIGLPGDRVQQRRGVIYVNGRRVAEPYLNRPRDTRTLGPWRVRPGHVFVMGDNRLSSCDSRFSVRACGVGEIPVDKIVGRAFIVIWPPSNFGGLTDGLKVRG